MEGIDMESTALRIYGKKDLRIDTFELPEMKDDPRDCRERYNVYVIMEACHGGRRP